MKQLALFVITLCFLPAYVHAQCTWNGTAGNWSDPTKWNNCGGNAPLATDNVVISSGTVTLDVSPTVQSLTQTGGIITGSGDINILGNWSMSQANTAQMGNSGNTTVGGDFIFNGGFVGKITGDAPGVVTVAGTTTMGPGVARYIYGKTLVLNGGGSFSANSMFFDHGGTLIIPAGQTLNLNSDAPTAFNQVNGLVINNGSVVKSGTGTFTCTPQFQNNGSIDIQGGIFSLNSSATYSGPVAVNAGTTFRIEKGNHQLSTITLDPTSTLWIQGAVTATFPSGLNYGNVTLQGGTYTFPGVNTMKALTLSGGTFQIENDLTVQSLTQTGGIITGSGDINILGNWSMSQANTAQMGNSGNTTVGGNFIFNGGFVGKITGDAPGVVTVAGTTTMGPGVARYIYGKTLVLNGGGSFSANSMFFDHGGTLIIPAGQTLNLNSDAPTAFNQVNGLVINNGSVVKSGTGTFTCTPQFQNNGSIDIQGGIFSLNSSATYSGPVAVNAGTTFRIEKGNHQLSTITLDPTSTLWVLGPTTATFPSGLNYGNVTLQGGTYTFPGVNTMKALTLSGGTFQIENDLTVQSLTQTGGIITGPGDINILGNWSMSQANTAQMGNSGNTTVSGDFIFNGGSVGKLTGDAPGVVTVAGTTTMGPGVARYIYGKTLVLNGGGSFSANSMFFDHGGTLTIPAGQTLNLNSNAPTAFNQVNGLVINNGSVVKSGTGTFTCMPVFFNHGILKGTNTINFSQIFTNTGTVAPGTSPGLLTLQGANIQLGTGTLEIEVSSNAGIGVGHDKLAVTGNVNLTDATLSAVPLASCAPNGTYEILSWTGTRTGDFASVLPAGATSVTYDDAAKKAFLTINQIEICNGLDDDCDGEIDEDVNGATWYADADGDGYGDPNVSETACTQPTGFVSNNLDCDDSNGAIHPTAAEICNGIDDDCDGQVDDGLESNTWYADSDGDGYGDPETALTSCLQPEGYLLQGGDCDDTDPFMHPGATEVCNGIDDDCDGLADDEDPGVNGQITWYADADGDGFGDPNVSQTSCSQPSGYVANDNDCNDAVATINPNATEICGNNLDDNCNGIIDEGCGSPLSVTAGDCQVVYLGYAPLSCTSLQASASGGSAPYTYTWSNGMTGAGIEVCPQSSQSYTVTVTDNLGNTASDAVNVEVVDVRCGNNNDKVLICHNGGNTLCLSANAIADHLGHGDALGTCGTDPCSSGGGSRPADATTSSPAPQPEKTHLDIYPNPAQDEIQVLLHGGLYEESTLEIVNFTGVVVDRQSFVPNPQTPETLRISQLPAGMYLIRWVSAGQVHAVKRFQVIR